ncbi:hypothetical protein [Maribacter halichondriae]|uniref:hypothetical protein n=1 Tax=Maribacter halichondriae TaxID=2980554 RepID=UPI00235A1839|nr:hypothetical protein [Maribacter sp. Hal144]
MKKLFKSSLYVGLLATAMVFTGCQKEEYDVPDPQEEGESLTASSATAKLMERTVSNDGSYDNIVDGASCFNIRFPYTVKVNGLEITIDSKEDLHLIEEIFDAVEDDENLLDIIFPITITMADYTEITINGEADLRELAKQCKEGGDDEDIECIDVVYPVTFFTLDTNSTQTGSVVVESDKEMRRFFAGLGENDLISIQYPVVLVMFDGTEVRVSSNAELAEAIEMAKDACDEDDDDDYNDDDFTKERLDALLVECPWLIRDIMRDNQLQTEQYFESIMNFTEDGAVNVIDRAGNNITGTWSTRVTDYRVLLRLEFDVLVDFNLDWFVYEISKDKIKLHEKDGNWIIMQKACDILNNDPSTLREVLRECDWIIKKVKVDGEEIKRLLGYEFSFQAEGIVTLSNGETIGEGTWEITTNEQGRLVMAIVMGDEPGVSFEWPLTDLRDDRLKFEIPGTDYELILERDCDNDEGDDDVAWIRGLFIDSLWNVALFSMNNDSMAQAYVYDDFEFRQDGSIVVMNSNGVMAETGRWLVYRNSEDKLEMIIAFGSESNYYPLANDYTIVEVEENRVELRHTNDEGGMDILVLEKK